MSLPNSEFSDRSANFKDKVQIAIVTPSKDYVVLTLISINTDAVAGHTMTLALTSFYSTSYRVCGFVFRRVREIKVLYGCRRDDPYEVGRLSRVHYE
jgi:hypothetical protein